MKSISLNNGTTIPILGLGTWLSKTGEVYNAVCSAIDVGYRHFDCAYVYSNEKEIGEAFKAKFSENVVKRSDLFITSKLWNTFHRKDLVENALKTTLSDLQISYLDLYLIHWPMAYKEGDEMLPKDADGNMLISDTDYLDTWRMMEKMVEQGLVKSIGLSNFNSKQVERILEIATIKPVMNQIECHPYLNQKKLIEYCHSKDIQVTGYSPLGSPNRPWVKPNEPVLLEDEKLKTIAEKYKKSVSQILIRYQIDRNVVVIPKSVNEERIKSNFEVFDFELSAEDIRTIDSFDCNGRFVGLEHVKHHPHYPFNIEF